MSGPKDVPLPLAPRFRLRRDRLHCHAVRLSRLSVAPPKTDCRLLKALIDSLVKIPAANR